MVTESASQAPPEGPRLLLRLSLPALVIGVGSSLLLIGVEEMAEELEHLLWTTLPDTLDVGRWSTGWMLAVLTVTGLAVGLVVWKVPGHAGPDPATTGLVDSPMAAATVPGVLLTSILALAGGVSLGPENPITASNIALAYWFGRRISPGSPAELWLALAAAGTIGALFGTPVAAALVLTETLAGGAVRTPRMRSLWDRLFAPLVAAGAGSITTVLISEPSFAVKLPPYSGPRFGDVAAALVIAAAGALLGMAAVHAFPYAHRAFRLLKHPVAMVTAGGVVLGLLAALGGHLTLFKGLDQMSDLTEDPGAWSSGKLALMAGVKLVAVVIASTCGFRGGRIFPSVFAGVALGLFAHALVPEVHTAVAVVCAVLGILLAVTRHGWLSLFTAAVLAPGITVLPLLILGALPAWLLVTGRPLMQLREDGTSVR
ncbi:ion channel protein [Streptomyces sp. NPDC051776]|uniref:ion channel protein n=1 Tax=Streptomyces sp. NPDC051776 TaxID=3155414 RepID=UPI0034315E59